MSASTRPAQAAPPPRTIHVVLPAFNEETQIGKLLDRIEEAMAEESLRYRVLVVDDGSTDATAEVVRQRIDRMPVSLMQHATNVGLGTTLRDGLVQAAEVASLRDVIVTMDADDTHTPGLIVRMVRMLREGHDVVIASRYQNGSRAVGVPRRRRMLSRGASIFFRLIFPTPGVRDFTCGFRAYRAEVLQAAIERYGSGFLDQDGFQCMVDILLKLRCMDVVFGEVPVILRYDFKEGGTKMKVAETIRNTLGLLVRARFTR